MQNKKTNGSVNNNLMNNRNTIWIHKSYPYIQKVNGDSLQNIDQLVSKLNITYKNANLEQLKQEIHDLKELHDGRIIAYDEMDKVGGNAPDLYILNNPILFKRSLGL